MSSHSFFRSKSLEETQWIFQIRRLIERNDLQTALETPISIFKLPNSITNENPESYFPHTLSLGPYHHLNPPLYNMEIFKLEKAKEAKVLLKLPYSFNQIVNEKLKPLDLKIRACFNKHLEMGSETLCWTMLIDSLFLLRLLGKGRFSREVNFPLPMFDEQRLYDGINGNLISQCEIVNDILKLENQIPFLVLEEIIPRKDIYVIFYPFCVSVSPFWFPDSCNGILRLNQVLEKSHHLLHFLYLLIINREGMDDKWSSMRLIGGGGDYAPFLRELMNVLAFVFQIDFLQQLNEVIGLVQSLFGLIASVNKLSSPAQIIPSASELEKVKMKFNCETFGGIRNPKFVRKTLTLRLPYIAINPFSEVVYRNLIAFEAMAKKDPPFFTQYVLLMSGLIATPKDVRILSRVGILNISGNFGSSDDIVKMFNGLRKTIGKQYSSPESDSASNSNTSMVKMDEFIKEINEYYESCWRVKAKRFMNKCVWSVFFLFMILLLIFVIVRTFCDWFSCPIFKENDFRGHISPS